MLLLLNHVALEKNVANSPMLFFIVLLKESMQNQALLLETQVSHVTQI